MKLSSADRKALVKLASGLPKGSAERRAILAGLKKTAGKKPQGPFRFFTSRAGRISNVSGEEFSFSQVNRFAKDSEDAYEAAENQGDDDYGYDVWEELSFILPLKVDREHDWSIVDTVSGDVFWYEFGWEFVRTMDLDNLKPGGRWLA